MKPGIFWAPLGLLLKNTTSHKPIISFPVADNSAVFHIFSYTWNCIYWAILIIPSVLHLNLNVVKFIRLQHFCKYRRILNRLSVRPMNLIKFHLLKMRSNYKLVFSRELTSQTNIFTKSFSALLKKYNIYINIIWKTWWQPGVFSAPLGRLFKEKLASFRLASYREYHRIFYIFFSILE